MRDVEQGLEGTPVADLMGALSAPQNICGHAHFQVKDCPLNAF